MHFHENTDSENDTEVIESQPTPYTDEPIAPSDYAVTEDDEDGDGLAADSSWQRSWFHSTYKLVGMFPF